MKPSIKPSEALHEDCFELKIDDLSTVKSTPHKASSILPEQNLAAKSAAVMKTVSQTPQEPIAPSSVCVLLQNQRKKLGIDLRKVSVDLRISESYLQAIEDAQINLLPERVYTLGFIQSYARYLDLEPHDIIRRFKAEVLGDAISPHYSMPKPVKGNALPNRWLIWLTVVMVVLGIGVGWIYYALDTPNLTKSNSIPAVIRNDIDAQIKNAELTDQTPAHSASTTHKGDTFDVQHHTEHHMNTTLDTSSIQQAHDPLNITDHFFRDQSAAIQAPVARQSNQNNTVTNQPVPLPAVGNLQFRFKALSWVEIHDQYGTTIVNRNFRPGEYYTIQPRAGLVFSTGNAGGIDVVLPTNQAFNLGKTGEVLHNISLTADRFQP